MYLDQTLPFVAGDSATMNENTPGNLVINMNNV